MSVPAISVLTSVYNAEAFVGEAIESVLAQDFAGFEFLIVDDRSTDATARIVADHAAADPRIRIVTASAKGRVPALNALVAAARAPWLAIVDGDDVQHSGRLARQMDYLARNPGCGVLGAEVRMVGIDGAPIERPPFTRPLDDAGIRANLEIGAQLSHNACVISRDAMCAVGGYRPAYRHAEDYDLWLRLSEVTTMANLPDRLVDYRIYPDQVSSRHVVEQMRNTAIGWLAHRERVAGRADPTDGFDAMPPLSELDTLFGPGAAAYVRRRVLDRVIYSPEALGGDAWDILIGHIHEDNSRDERLWRTAARLLRAGRPIKAGRVAAGLLGLNPGLAA
ncbi:MAG: glycosyltransferase [Sphingomonadales bacterium]|nr:glycosyltransferase [Sphingomonadales bacterium]MDE2570544.1 glycosyltransferase [Sphingomonadales bacterium]